MEKNRKAEIIAYAKCKRLTVDENGTLLRGVVRDERGGLFKYYLEIDVSFWPRLFPRVIETDHRIIRKADNHVYTSGIFCLDTESRQSYLINTGQVKSLIHWHEAVLLPYLANQHDYHNGYKDAFRGQELAHGFVGIIQGYALILKTDFDTTLSLLPHIFFKEKWSGNKGKAREKSCLCQSGIKGKKCKHKKSIIHKYIDPDLFKNDFLAIRDGLNFHPSS